MKTMMLTLLNRIAQIRTYCDNMFSFPCSKSLKWQHLSIREIAYVCYEQDIIIGRRLRT